MRRLALTGALAGIVGAAGPTAYEGFKHNEGQQDKIENAINKIVQENYFTTDPAAAGQYKDTRDQKLHEIATASYGSLNPGWDEPVQLFQSGVKRMTNGMPSVSRIVLEPLGFGPEYYNGHYKTAFDDMADYVSALAKYNVSIAFDQNLAKLNAGSAYTRDTGMITINPELSQGDMVEHLRRHILRLNQELVQPHQRLVESGGSEFTGTFNERVGLFRAMNSLFEGPVVTLPFVNGANAEFAEVPRKNYTPPLLKQAAPQPEQTAQPVKGQQPAPGAKAKKPQVAAK
jgi:hypothetical protein